MKTLMLSGLLTLFTGLYAYSQDASTWSTHRNGSIVPDTVALQDYLPTKDGNIYVEKVVELPNTTKQELFSRAKLAVQKTFAGNKMNSSNYDLESGICSINNFYDISDRTFMGSFSSDPATDNYSFNALLSIIVKDGKYKISLEIPQYTYSQTLKYDTYADFQAHSLPVSKLANSKQNLKRQRMRVLKTLNEKMWATFESMQKEMERKLDTDF